MMTSPQAIIQRNCIPLTPIPVGECSVLRPLSDIRAVLFDVYGTMFVSASGDIATMVADGSAFSQALAAVGICLLVDGDVGQQLFLDTIRAEHRRQRSIEIDWPEIDVRWIWKQTLATLRDRGLLAGNLHALDLERLAIEYEVRANPVWPMPNLRESLESLRRKGIELGIISNAQFYTRELFSALLCKPAEQLGFSPELEFYSYDSGRAKPSLWMYRAARQSLARKGIETANAVFVGNDMLHDILPASRTGFRTALFAGDARSLRHRSNDPRVAGLVPDLIVTDLSDLVACVSKS